MSRSRIGASRPPSSPRQSTAPSGGFEQSAGNGAAAQQASGESQQGGFLSRLFGGGSSSNDSAGGAAADQGGPEWGTVVGGSLTLRRGSKGPATEQLQRLLVQNGARITVDGDFGNGTHAAVRNFQASKGITVDGIVGAGTAGHLSGGRAAAPRGQASGQREVADAREAARGGSSGASTQQGRGPGQRPDIAVSATSFVRNGLRREVFETALRVFQTAWARGDTQKMIYTVIDFSVPSHQKRMWVIDLQSGRLLFHELVAHGARSGGDTPSSFSNTNGSHQSSIGLARTAETYDSQKFGGKGLRMDGLERGYNSNMRARAVVMHQATYATPEAIEANRRSEGAPRLGRSQGCPAMDPRVAGQVIETIKNGSLVFSYYPDPEYLRQSQYVNG